MDRYRLLIKKDPKPIAYQFRPSNSIIRVASYMIKCITDHVDFYANDINHAILDDALIRVSKETGYPIIVESEIVEKVWRMTYGYKKIYSPGTLPASVYQVICVSPINRKNVPGKEVVLLIKWKV
jgi:hypothetical protein